ncbi:MAG TPA: STN domain-containing protein, partial [Gemmata sp.]|nr:STN domain-containing protein [Gemmata sp.]
STDERLGDILKEFAAQADREADRPVLWAYGPDFPYAKKITIAIKDKPIDEALDLLLQKAGGGLGYVVVSKDGDKYDGWVRLTTTGERGTAEPDPAAEEEATAAERLAVVKRLIDAGKAASAKPLLTIIVKNYPRTKAGMEAKTLLEKLDK